MLNTYDNFSLFQYFDQRPLSRKNMHSGINCIVSVTPFWIFLYWCVTSCRHDVAPLFPWKWQRITVSYSPLPGINLEKSRTVCLWLATLLSSLIARRWVRLQTLWWFWLKDLSIDEMVGAWCFGCLSGPPGFTCWISFAPVFSFIYCWVLIFALSPCYILIYMF